MWRSVREGVSKGVSDQANSARNAHHGRAELGQSTGAMTPAPLSRGGLISYGIGGFGWAAASQVVGIQLVYFYIPPMGGGCVGLDSNSSLASGNSSRTSAQPIFPTYITQTRFAVVLNAIVILASLGRLWDAVTDPWIAHFSDRLRWKRGRRIPVMALSALPAALFAALLFFPIVPHESAWNIVWLAATQALFYVALTGYCTPYFALVPEFGHTEKQRLHLAMAGSVSFALGSVFAGSAPTIGGISGPGRAEAQLQAGIAVVCALSALCMFAPVAVIDERRHCHEATVRSAAAACLAALSFGFTITHEHTNSWLR